MQDSARPSLEAISEPKGKTGKYCARGLGPKSQTGRGPYEDRKNWPQTGRARRGPEGNESDQGPGRSFRPASPEAPWRLLTSAVHSAAHDYCRAGTGRRLAGER